MTLSYLLHEVSYEIMLKKVLKFLFNQQYRYIVSLNKTYIYSGYLLLHYFYFNTYLSFKYSYSLFLQFTFFKGLKES